MDSSDVRRGTHHRGTLRFRPSHLLLRLLALPVYLYRLGLGRLFGHRFLMLTYRGRKTGRIRRVVVEVILYDRERRESTVVAGWGERTGWYRNLRAAPALELQTGGERYAPQHRILTDDETFTAIRRYERRHPFAARVLARLFDVPLRGSEQQRRAAIANLRLVAFRPRE